MPYLFASLKVALTVAFADGGDPLSAAIGDMRSQLSRGAIGLFADPRSANYAAEIGNQRTESA